VTERTPLFMDIDNVYSADELGLPYRDLVTEGILKTNGLLDLKVTQRGAGANLSVDVAKGAAWVLGDTSVDLQPCYRIYNDATVNLGITADPTNPRKVLVIAQVTDAGFAGATRNWALQALHGTPAGSPVEPALPASALPLALIDVTAADASIIDNQITDRRVYASLGSNRVAANTYTPVWGSFGTAPALGNGTITGRYYRLGALVVVKVMVTMGSTTTFGTSIYTLTLPTGLPSISHDMFHGTSARLLDSSVPLSAQSFAFFNNTTSMVALTDAGSLVAATVPFTWATGDILSMSAIYETSA
jgi:hypothetical protein